MATATLTKLFPLLPFQIMGTVWKECLHHGVTSLTGDYSDPHRMDSMKTKKFPETDAYLGW